MPNNNQLNDARNQNLRRICVLLSILAETEPLSTEEYTVTDRLVTAVLDLKDGREPRPPKPLTKAEWAAADRAIRTTNDSDDGLADAIRDFMGEAVFGQKESGPDTSRPYTIAHTVPAGTTHVAVSTFDHDPAKTP